LAMSSNQNEFVSSITLLAVLFKWPIYFLSILRFLQVLHFHYQVSTYFRYQLHFLSASFKLMSNRWIPLLPRSIVNVWILVHRSILASVGPKLKIYGLWTTSHKERRQVLHGSRRRCNRFSRIYRTVLFMMLIPTIFSSGFTFERRRPSIYDKSFDVHDGSRRQQCKMFNDGRQRLFRHKRKCNDDCLKAYDSSYRSRQGWDSLPKQTYSTDFRLQAESVLLVRLYTHTFENRGNRISIPFHPTIRFKSTMFESNKKRRLLQDHFPDLSDIFKSLTPTEPKVFHTAFKVFDTACSFQSRAEKDCSICFDMGCSLSSTFDIKDFESPPVKGRFGQLRTINGIVPIDAAGIIKWTVLDINGKQVEIRVPGYYIPLSSQRLLSPQNYATFHQWANSQADCYGGNDKWLWMKIAMTEKGELPEV